MIARAPDGPITHWAMLDWAHVDAPSPAPYGMRQVYLRDPDGFSLCLQHGVEAESRD